MFSSLYVLKLSLSHFQRLLVSVHLIPPPVRLRAVKASEHLPVSIMALPVSRSQKSLESPFSHIEMYGVEHPTLGRSSHTSRSVKAKPKSQKSHKSSAVKLKKSEASRSRSSTTSVSRGHRKKKKKSETPKCETTKSSERERSYSTTHSSHTQTRVHSVRPPSVVVTSPSLAKVDQSSPCQVKRKLSAQGNSWKGKSRAPSSETTSGYSSNKTQCSEFKISESSLNSSVISHSSSTISTTDVLLSLSESQDNLKSKIINSPINVSLKKASQTTQCFPSPTNRAVLSRTFSSTAGLKSQRSLKSSAGGKLTVEDIVWGLGRLQYKSVIVMSGAGISTPSGIPDFRSPGTGLYDNLKQYRIPDPTAIFDIGFFSRNPKPFFTLAKELYPGKYQPNTVHHFVHLLQEKGVLLRNYTQNIDGLERIAGISPGKLVEAHGSFSTASCIKCKSKQEPEEVKAAIFDGKVPRCKYKYCMGLVKPDIVFFGEDLPARFHSLQLRDFSKCDLLIIMGTSLEVEPFASLCTLSRFNVPRLLINRELVGPFKHGRKRVTDVAMTGDLVDSVVGVIEGAGLAEDLRCLLGEPPGEEIETIRASASIDVQTVASEDTFSHISTESEPAMLSPIFSDSTLPDQDNADTALATQMAHLKLTQEDRTNNSDTQTCVHSGIESESVADKDSGELKWQISRNTETDQ